MLCTGKGRAVANTATAEVLVMLATDGTAPTDKRVELKITNGEAYASISQKGMLIIKKSGASTTVEVTVTALDGSGVRKTCTVEIRPA